MKPFMIEAGRDLAVIHKNMRHNPVKRHRLKIRFLRNRLEASRQLLGSANRMKNRRLQSAAMCRMNFFRNQLRAQCRVTRDYLEMRSNGRQSMRELLEAPREERRAAA